MQPKTDLDASGQGSAGGTNGGGGTADPLAALIEQIKELDRRITELQGEIQQMEASLKTATAAVERARNLKKDLDARRASLGRLVDGYKSGQQKTASQRQAAEADAKAARELLDQVRADLEQELSDEHRQEIDQVIEDVDKHIAELSDAESQKQNEVNQAETALSDAKAASSGADAAVRQAQSDLQGLPGMFQSLATQVKKSRAALEKAFGGGQATQAYLLTHELESALDQLESHLDPAHEQALAQKVQDAWTAYEAASDAVPNAEAKVTETKAELEQIQTELKDYTDNRQAKIQAKLEEEASGESTGGASPAVAGAEQA